MKEILKFETLLTGKILAVAWILFSLLALIAIPLAGVRLFIDAGGCGVYDHLQTYHMCHSPPLGTLVATLIGATIAAAFAIVITRISAELVIVVFRIYEELRASTASRGAR